MQLDLGAHFPEYTEFPAQVAVWCATPHEGRTIHRFFDTSPLSPSGRYLALTRFATDERLPQPGDTSHVVVVDLRTGEETVVAETRGADTQLGAQVQWGADDTELFFNDVDTASWLPFGVKLDPLTARTQRIGSVYMVSPDGKQAASPCLRRTARTQAGYGVIVPPQHIPENRGAPEDDGVYVTDTTTGHETLLVSLAEIFEHAIPHDDKDEFVRGDFYAFHVKYNPQGDRIAVVIRWKSHDEPRRMRHSVVTFSADGTDIRSAIPFPTWDAGGHHPNWTADGRRIMMNLTVEGVLRLVSARYDGTDFAPVSEHIEGSGHPSMRSDGHLVLTDVYEHGRLAWPDGTAPLRLLDLQDHAAKNLVRISLRPAYEGPAKEFRVDPHPAWDRSFRYVIFNACQHAVRRVYIADLSAHLT